MKGIVDEKLRSLIRVSVSSAAEAILADGQSDELEMHQYFVDWFGATYETQVAANDSEFPLLGTQLLDGHKLEVDYRAKTIELN